MSTKKRSSSKNRHKVNNGNGYANSKRKVASPNIKSAPKRRADIKHVETKHEDIDFVDANKIDASKIDASKIDASKVDTSDMDVSYIETSHANAKQTNRKHVNKKHANTKNVNTKRANKKRENAKTVNTKKVNAKPAKREQNSESSKKIDIATLFGKQEVINQLSAILPVLIINVAAIFIWELLIFIETGGIRLSSLFFLFFLPSQALLLTAFNGWYKSLITRILTPLLLFVVSIYYIIQTIYYRNFGSLFSISMMGMGNDALGNFWWALKDTVSGAIGKIILILIPVLVVLVLCIINKPKLKSYHLIYHGFVLLLAVVMWFVGLLGIRCFGNDRQSAYYLFTNTSVDTDTAAKKLGTMTTAFVEAGSFYFGIGQSGMDDFSISEEEDNSILKVQASKVTQSNIDDEEVTEAEDDIERIPWIDENLDIASLADKMENDELKKLTEYFAGREATTTNEYTGMFEGYNLIYICAESFWSYGCNETVTPTLYKMAHNGIVLNNYYNSLKNTTTNGEFAFATSLWPDVSRDARSGTDIGSFPRSASTYMPQGLGDLFTAQGIPSYAFHNYFGRYYRRILSWPNLGYKCKFTGDGMWFTSNWPSSDLELIQQSVDDYINDEQFHAYYMTFSGHGPYTSHNYMFRKNIGEVQSILGDNDYHSEAIGYLAGELELDKAMKYLLDRLEEAGKLDNTVIVIAGDHYPYYLSTEGRESLTGIKMDEDFDIYKSNCIIYNAGIKEPIECDTYCCNVDIAPTMLNLFNIPFDSRLMMGRDIFSDGVHRAALYNKSFITDMVKYDYVNGTTEWSEASSILSNDDKRKYLSSMLSLVENEYTASCKVVSDNFYMHLYRAAGLLTGEELENELKREESVRAQDEYYNAQDEAREAERMAQQEAEKAQEENAEDIEAQLEEWRKQVEEQQKLENGGQGGEGNIANPEAVQPNAGQPGEAQPNAVQPNAGQPGEVQPNLGQPDAAIPNQPVGAQQNPPAAGEIKAPEVPLDNQAVAPAVNAVPVQPDNNAAIPVAPENGALPNTAN